MTAQQKTRKPKSPPVPSKNLEGCIADVQKLYGEYSHGTFSRSELASALGVSASSGPFATRLSSLRQFGLIEPVGTDYKVSEKFMALNSNARDSAAFKTAALDVIKLPATFRELLDDFPSKLPSKDAVASRLETQKKFNKEAAVRAAAVLEESLRYAGVLDGSNNILPVRDGGAGHDKYVTKETDDTTDDTPDLGSASTTAALRVEVPVGDRKVVVHYPHDLTADEAKKVGAVLAAIVS
jgi:hypothetical protein